MTSPRELAQALEGLIEAATNTVQFWNMGEFDIQMKDLDKALSRLDQAMGKPGDENPVYIRPPEDTF